MPTIRLHHTKPSSRLERLPFEVQQIIFSHLDYQSLIFLSTMNRFFHRVVDPGAMADPADKFQFIMRAAKDFPQHRPREKSQGNFECYVCYKIHGPDHFDWLQPQSVWVDERGHVIRDRTPHRGRDREIMLRRFCIECGIKTGLHAPTDCLTTRTGRELWVCHCRRVWEKPKHLRCPQCSGDCPLRPRKKL
ncbi:hypothetical protein NLU13_5465 [Sarocladium strictum]|uniref:F-box domain-containing protein n=1 Tax=Sarocladium strictum TaxID=5046 RepID=A0AA39L7N5_SARSR|nr:hypothetical protein NLU13_5465 [Sarocladium strictum]